MSFDFNLLYNLLNLTILYERYFILCNCTEYAEKCVSFKMTSLDGYNSLVIMVLLNRSSNFVFSGLFY